MDYSTEEIAGAIQVVNRYAKAALNPKQLYWLKKLAIQRLVSEGKATVLGYHHFGGNDLLKQNQVLIIECGEFKFHQTPQPGDLQKYEFLKDQHNFKNSRVRIPLSRAKEILSKYGYPTSKASQFPQRSQH
jgi:hypothetical protein